MNYLRMQDLDLKHKRVLIREDFNVPIENGIIQNDARIRAALNTIQQAIEAKAALILISHLGRPTEGVRSKEFSLKPVAHHLSQLLGQPVRFVEQWLEGVDVAPGEVVLCENVRFNPGEENNDPVLAKKMAALCDIFIMDAFGTAHRAQASTVGVAQFAPIAAAGPLLCSELEALSKVLIAPKRPVVAIVGGSKVSTKLAILESLTKVVDVLIVGGGIANTFIAASGYAVGSSLVETSFIPIAQKLMQQKHVDWVIPSDVVVATEISNTAHTHIVEVNQNIIAPDEKILDVGPQTIQRYQACLAKAGTVLWNGPVGVFEYLPFEAGTIALAKAIAASSAYSVAGGGDTLAAIDKYKVTDNISYISTGGGAFLEALEGKTLPAVKILEERNKNISY
jgi:phosphoglycerate kinase